MDSDHKGIYSRYLRESHTWKRQFKIIDSQINDFPSYTRQHKTYIISAIHVPEDVINLSVRIFSIKYTLQSYIDWFDQECPLGSILIESRRVPESITESGYRRIVPYYPFIYLSDESYMKIDLDGIRSSDYCYIEYYELKNVEGPVYPQVRMNLEPNLVFGDTFNPYEDSDELAEYVWEFLDDTDHSYKIDREFGSRLPNTDYDIGSGIP